MARFFVLGPLVLVLCMVLFTDPSPTHTENPEATVPDSNSFTPTTSPNTPATTKVTDPSPTHTPAQVTKPSETATSPSPSLTSAPVPKPSETVTRPSPALTSQVINPGEKGSSDSPTTMQPTPPPPALPKGTGDGDTQPSTFTKASNTPTNTNEGETVNNTDSSTLTSTTNTPTNTTKGSISDNNQTNTSISPTLTTLKQQNTSTSAGVRNDTASLPSTGSPTSMHSSSTSPSPTFTTTFTTTMGPTQSQCQYNLTKSENKIIARVVIISGLPNQTYTITLMDKKNNDVLKENGSNLKPLRIPFRLLKPCSIYTVSVDGCVANGYTTFTSSSGKGETVPETVVTNVTDKEVCLKGIFNDTQKWNLTECVEITEQNSCASTHTVELDTCTYTMNVSMPPVKPEIRFNTSIPSQFEWTNKPEKCMSTLEVICNRGNQKDTYGLNEPVSLLPNQHYTCTGEYPYETRPIKSDPLSIHIDCDLKKNASFTDKSHNSIHMSWKAPEEDNCSNIIWSSYSATCQTSEKREPASLQSTCTQGKADSTHCTNTQLHPFTTYTCIINAKLHGHEYTLFSINQTTFPAEPELKSITVQKPSHNSVHVQCSNLTEPNDWNGDAGHFEAVIKYNGDPIKPLEKKRHCWFSFSDLHYLTTYEIEVTATNKQNNRTVLHRDITTNYNDKAVVGFLVFLIIVTSAALLFVLFKIYLLKRKRSAEDEEIPLTPEPLRRVEPIYADGLIEAYKNKIADESRLFMDEFQSIPRIFSNYTIKEAKKQDNQSKNRYVDILPYDYNRVTLSTGGEDEYINASFIEGYQEPKKYIAAQGPKDETVCDFWRMVWEQKSSIIVMVTRCEEGNKIKCAQYWPSLDRETEIFDDFVVKIRSEQHCPDYIIRHLMLTNKREKASEREVTHIQFISWPDHGVPGDPSLLLKLRRRVNSFKNFFSGPVVVHCSAGVGRTGTYIGIDAMIESLEAEGRMDIYGFVAKLRRQRCLMVQVEAQYILIHTALIEHNQFGETEVSLSEFHSALNTLRQKDGSDPNLLEIEFQRLPKFKNWRTFNTGSSEDNKKKNRYSAVIPYDFNRVLFRLDIEGNQTSDPEDEDEYSSDEEEESNEYINASFIDGYWCHKSLIAAQGPLPNTTSEFLLMLYQQQTKTLVMLTDCQEDGKDYCCQYWGDEKKTFGDMEIEVKKTESFPTYVRRRLEIQSTKKEDVLEVDQYQFLKWRGRELPENPQELIEMIRVIRENGNYDNSRMNRNVPMVVHCNNGSSRTGIFCALWNILDNAYTEKLVDIFQVVKNLRKERQGMVEAFEQYQFLYTALESAFPVQNGTVKTPPANDTTQVINETTALLDEPKSTSAADQKEAEESKAAESSDKTNPGSEQEAKESSTAEAPPAEGEKPSAEGTTNGPAATVEV
ncbi:receptor-type tyrosine-protein phosphatase C isoform X6 [Onychostoma macrolepis]|uniref:receptor-type tyrosine-protein phosphatase C isoform X6 n=1 Tax=Onychostoma macrolepis TaxID=369639 RepID=UPI002729D59B|nr:receptor-type tyrosine-protein phosphatase C isoform X6 [Onychostoma macrolepis]